MCVVWRKEESLNHLMVECLFTKEIWNSIIKELHLKRIWGGGPLCDCYQDWIKEMEYWKELPCYICWEIWKHKNMIIFEEHNLSLARVCNRILQDLGENKKIQIAQHHRITRPPLLDWNLAVGFFDGASQCEGSKCGAGAILKCPELGFYSLKLNCGPGTNTRGELLALWSILFFAHYKQIKSLQLVGDSKVIIDWFSLKTIYR
jgi:hypothetical protein